MDLVSHNDEKIYILAVILYEYDSKLYLVTNQIVYNFGTKLVLRSY
jgi:hypothetical protein